MAWLPDRGVLAYCCEPPMIRLNNGITRTEHLTIFFLPIRDNRMSKWNRIQKIGQTNQPYYKSLDLAQADRRPVRLPVSVCVKRHFATRLDHGCRNKKWQGGNLELSISCTHTFNTWTSRFYPGPFEVHSLGYGKNVRLREAE